MAGSVWPTLAAGAKAKASEVESKFDWIELDIVPMSAGTKTDATYDLGESSFRWRDILFSRQIIGGAGSIGSPAYTFTTDPNSGLISDGADELAMVTGGATRLIAKNTLITVIEPLQGPNESAISPTYSWTNAQSSGMYWSGTLIRFAISATDVFEITATNVRPPSDNSIPIGETTRRFSEVHTLIVDAGASDLTLRSNSQNVMVLDTTGTIIKPFQSSFLAYNSVTDSGAVGNNNVVRAEFDTEVYDQNADFDPVNDIYTVPTSARVLLCAVVELQQLTTTSHTDLTVDIVTSNRTYRYSRTVTGYPFQNISCPISVIADMDASDTAVVNVNVAGATADVDIAGGASPHETYFSGSVLN